MDTIKIFLNNDSIITTEGELQGLSSGKYIKAKLIDKMLVLTTTDTPELYNPYYLFTKSFDSPLFTRFVISYLYWKGVSGMVLKNIDGSYIDCGLNETELKNEIDDIGKTIEFSDCIKNVEVRSVHDLLFASDDYNSWKNLNEQQEVLDAKSQLDHDVDIIKTKLGMDIVRSLNLHIVELMTVVGKNQFKSGYCLGLNYLADLSDIPGNTITERLKEELE